MSKYILIPLVSFLLSGCVSDHYLPASAFSVKEVQRAAGMNYDGLVEAKQDFINMKAIYLNHLRIEAQENPGYAQLYRDFDRLARAETMPSVDANSRPQFTSPGIQIPAGGMDGIAQIIGGPIGLLILGAYREHTHKKRAVAKEDDHAKEVAKALKTDPTETA